jgi:YHS domain-containing protein
MRKEIEQMVSCPVCGMMVDERTAPSSEHGGKMYYFMNPTHKAMFDKDPERFIRPGAGQRGMHGMQGMKD